MSAREPRRELKSREKVQLGAPTKQKGRTAAIVWRDHRTLLTYAMVVLAFAVVVELAGSALTFRGAARVLFDKSDATAPSALGSSGRDPALGLPSVALDATGGQHEKVSSYFARVRPRRRHGIPHA